MKIFTRLTDRELNNMMHEKIKYFSNFYKIFYIYIYIYIYIYSLYYPARKVPRILFYFRGFLFQQVIPTDSISRHIDRWMKV